jgi:hypothetical protein
MFLAALPIGFEWIFAGVVLVAIFLMTLESSRSVLHSIGAVALFVLIFQVIGLIDLPRPPFMGAKQSIQEELNQTGCESKLGDSSRCVGFQEAKEKCDSGPKWEKDDCIEALSKKYGLDRRGEDIN